MTRMRTPMGHAGVEHADGAIHAIALDMMDHPEFEGKPLWRITPVCETASGVSSDEGGHAALHKMEITCGDCIAILG